MTRKELRGILLILGMVIGVSLLLYLFFFAERIPSFNIVRLEGMSTYGNYSHLDPFVSVVKENPNRRPALLLWENDFFYITDDPKGPTFFATYKKSDGTRLSFRKEGDLLIQADRPVSLNIRKEAEDGAWEWIKTAGRDKIKSLRFLTMTPEGPAEFDLSRIKLLKKVAGINPHVGLAIDSAHIDRVLPLFRPHTLFLSIDSPLTEKQTIVLSNERQLRMLWVSFTTNKYDSKSLEFLSRLPRLTWLGISGGDEAGQLPPYPKNLRSLTLLFYKIKDISGLARFTGLRELSLPYGEFEDIEPLSKLNNLAAIDLTGCGGISNISVLKNMRGLRYIGVPNAISQEDFASLIHAHPDLQILQLVGCQQVKDISPLKKLRSLDALILLPVPSKEHPLDLSYYAPLRGMTNLRYLALNEEVTANDEEMRKLEKAIPKCQIVAARGACLGSGWILLLLAVPFLSFLAVWRHNKPSEHPRLKSRGILVGRYT